MNYSEAYAAGFCKTAAELGIDPVALVNETSVTRRPMAKKAIDINALLGSAKATGKELVGKAVSAGDRVSSGAKNLASAAKDTGKAVSDKAVASGRTASGKLSAVLAVLRKHLDKGSVLHGAKGGLMGAGLGYSLTPYNASQGKKIRNMLLGAGAGAATGVAAGKALSMSPEQVEDRKARIEAMLKGLRTKITPAAPVAAK